MSYLGICMWLLDIIYLTDATFIFLFVFSRMYVFGIQFPNRFPRLQGHLDKILGDRLQDRYIMETNLGVCFIMGRKIVLLGDDDPYGTSIDLVFLYLIGLDLYFMARIIGGRGFICNCLVILGVTTDLAIMAICSSPFILHPAMVIIFSLLYLLLMISSKMQLTGHVNVVNEQTEHEMQFWHFVTYGIGVSVAMATLLMIACNLSPDFEKTHLRTVEWLRFYAFVVFWTLTAAKVLKQGVFRLFHLFIATLTAMCCCLHLFCMTNQRVLRSSFCVSPF